ncbi:MAG: IS1182 family transposase, partial [Bacteroidia bacterium]|nr:IS1182 family transposase [Bacteroidia bacterium]MBL7932677.1 IS1182 family transposase [Bacteroidia bacterium]
MDYISPFNREQYEFVNLEDCIDVENPVRFIDAFVDKLDLFKLGFKINTLKSEGRPAFPGGLFL